MANFSNALERLTVLLESDALISETMFRGIDVVEVSLDCRGGRSYGGERFAADCATEDAGVTLPEDKISEMSQLANRKAKSILVRLGLVTGESLELVCMLIESDFEIIARTIATGLNTPFVNGVLLSYRAGKLPYLPLEIPGDLVDFLDIDQEEAKLLVAIAEKKTKAELAEAENEEHAQHQALDEALKSAGEALPEPDVLLTLLQIPLIEPNTTQPRLATSLSEIEGKSRLPKPWVKLLAAQDNGSNLPWGEVWGGFEERMPSIFRFLQNYCWGVALYSGDDRPPALLYLYRFAFGEFSAGYTYGAFIGERPLGKRLPTGTKKRFDLLPPDLQHFYRQVHNGWTQISFHVYGPLPIQRVDFLGRNVMQEQASFPVDTALEVMRTRGGGGVLCLATETRNKQGESSAVYWDTQSESETGLDFWEELNRRIDACCENLIPVT